VLMRRSLGVILFVTFIRVAGLAQELTLDQILKKNEDALGGAEVISKVQTLRVTYDKIEINVPMEDSLFKLPGTETSPIKK